MIDVESLNYEKNVLYVLLFVYHNDYESSNNVEVIGIFDNLTLAEKADICFKKSEYYINILNDYDIVATSITHKTLNNIEY